MRDPYLTPIQGDLLLANGVARHVLGREGEWVLYHVIGYPKHTVSKIWYGSWVSWCREYRPQTLLMGR